MTQTAAAEQLANVLAQENEALLRLDFSTAVGLVPAKEAALAGLTRQPAEPPPPASIIQRLRSLATENQILLERAIEVQTRVVRIVARACAPPVSDDLYNGRHGQRRPTAPRTAALALSTRA